jgi:hypothetical protein
VDEDAILVGERTGSLGEGHSVLGLVGRVLAVVPLEADLGHADSVPTPYVRGKLWSRGSVALSGAESWSA